VVRTEGERKGRGDEGAGLWIGWLATKREGGREGGKEGRTECVDVLAEVGGLAHRGGSDALLEPPGGSKKRR